MSSTPIAGPADLLPVPHTTASTFSKRCRRLRQWAPPFIHIIIHSLNENLLQYLLLTSSILMVVTLFSVYLSLSCMIVTQTNILNLCPFSQQ